MEVKESLMLDALSELMDLGGEKRTREKNRSWIKNRSVSGYFSSIIRERKKKKRECKDKEMFGISAEEFVK